MVQCSDYKVPVTSCSSLHSHQQLLHHWPQRTYFPPGNSSHQATVLASGIHHSSCYFPPGNSPLLQVYTIPRAISNLATVLCFRYTPFRVLFPTRQQSFASGIHHSSCYFPPGNSPLLQVYTIPRAISHQATVLCFRYKPFLVLFPTRQQSSASGINHSPCDFTPAH